MMNVPAELGLDRVRTLRRLQASATASSNGGDHHAGAEPAQIAAIGAGPGIGRQFLRATSAKSAPASSSGADGSRLFLGLDQNMRGIVFR